MQSFIKNFKEFKKKKKNPTSDPRHYEQFKRLNTFKIINGVCVQCVECSNAKIVTGMSLLGEEGEEEEKKKVNLIMHTNRCYCIKRCKQKSQSHPNMQIQHTTLVYLRKGVGHKKGLFSNLHIHRIKSS